MSDLSPGPAFDAVLFDLDGTLVDSRPGILAAARGALSEAGLSAEVPTAGGMLGRPLGELIAAIAPELDGDGRALLAASFRRRYDAADWRASEPYPGVAATVAALRNAGVRLFVITNKRLAPTLSIVEARGLRASVEVVYAPDSRTPGYGSKDEMGRACMREQGLRDETTLVVGDSVEDLRMARECRVSFAAAAWGYGDAAAELTAGAEGFLYDSTSGRRERVLGAMSDLLALVMPEESSEAVHEP